MNISEKKLKFVKKIALEYRLSLKSICKILGVDCSEQSQMELYKQLMKVQYSNNGDENSWFSFLFYETVNQLPSDEKKSFIMSQLAILKNDKALLSGESEKIREVRNQFIRFTDTKFKKLISDTPKRDLVKSNITTISQYRIKYALSQEEVARILGVERQTISKYEKTIEDSKMKSELEMLNDYNCDKRMQVVKALRRKK